MEEQKDCPECSSSHLVGLAIGSFAYVLCADCGKMVSMKESWGMRWNRSIWSR